MEKGAFQQWLDVAKLREISDPEVPTFRAGTTTNGVLVAPGEYAQEGISLQETDTDTGGGPLEASPAIATGEPVFADHHALILDLFSLALDAVPPLAGHNVHSFTKAGLGGARREVGGGSTIRKM